MVYKFFAKKVSGIKSMPNQQLADELHKPIIRKFKKRKVYSSFNIQYLGSWSCSYAVNKQMQGVRFCYQSILNNSKKL